MEPITVSQLNSYVKAMLDMDTNLRNILISGEITNFKKHSSGTLYFSLRDQESIVKAVMFSSKITKKSNTENLKNGMQVVVQGNVRCYENTGSYQIYVEKIFIDGTLGNNYTKLELLKLKLLSQNFFDESRKKNIPKYPQKIGIITSETGSVIQDIRKVISRRYRVCELILYPVEVQGKNSCNKICSGIRYFNTPENQTDVIIIARGGGSNEDLSVFNEENLAVEIYNSEIPIISAIGHETDFTICDLVADRRASTPSVAAEIAVPDSESIINLINNYEKNLETSVNNIFDRKTQKINLLDNLINTYSPDNKIKNYMNSVNYFNELLIKNMSFYLAKKEFLIENLNKRLEKYSKNNILDQGYSIIFDNIYKKHIKSIYDFSDNTNKIDIIMKDGKIECEINNIKKI
ncbi:MAG: exodeoxyribonuclease VII large subunit [Clostridia bacterium]|nr:exodeoxyribonuclease VII large subunit [Clostridia bacterium]